MRHGKPEIFNTDQGSQSNGSAFTGALASNGIAISMDRRGAWRDDVFVERLWRSVKYEEVYLRAYETVSEARDAIGLFRQPAPALLTNLTSVMVRSDITSIRSFFRRLSRSSSSKQEIVLGESHLAVNNYLVARTERDCAFVGCWIKCRDAELIELMDAQGSHINVVGAPV